MKTVQRLHMGKLCTDIQQGDLGGYRVKGGLDVGYPKMIQLFYFTSFLKNFLKRSF